MGRESTGTVKWMRNTKTGQPQWHARWSLGDGARTHYVALDEPIPESDRAGALVCAAKWAPQVRAEAKAVPGKIENVANYADRWLDERAKRLASVKDDRSRLRDHVLPRLGKLDVRTFTRDDVESVRDALDEKVRRGALAWKTAECVWTLVRTLCDDLANARDRGLRARADNPAAGVKPPLRGKRKEKQYLYPSEFLTFMACPRVPREWKIAAALALYSYGRDGEVAKLDWRDVDLEHGVLRITRARDRDSGGTKSTKTGATRRFSVEPNLLPLLRAMHKRAGGKGKVFEFDATHLSRTFRRWLLVAGVTRHELHATTASSRAITWHDLRATGATWMAVRGDKPLAIRQRCGHSSFTTTELYIREAEVLAEGFGDVFPPLPSNCHPIATGRIQVADLAENKADRERDTRFESGSENSNGRDKQAAPAFVVEFELPRLVAPKDEPRERAALTSAQRSPVQVAELEAAIDRLSRFLASAPDEVVSEVVRERASMRQELADFRMKEAGNVVVFEPRRRK